MATVASELRPPDRRVRRTQKAIREAFISLVLERGYDHVLIEDIANRADIGRATFYAHYSDKDDLFAQLFGELSDELTAKITAARGSPDVLRTYLTRMLFEDAYASRDLFRICLNGAGSDRARTKYQQTVEAAAARVFTERVEGSPHGARVPVAVMARAYAGAHVALLKSWLDDDVPAPVDEVVRDFLELMFYGYAWSLGIVADDYVTKLPQS